MNAFAVLLVLAPLQAQNHFGMEYVVTDKLAYLMLPPQAVGSSQTTFASWSPSGRYLLMGSYRPKLDTAVPISPAFSGVRPKGPSLLVSIWDKHSNKTTELGTIPQFRSEFSWFSGTDVTLNEYLQEDADRPFRLSLIRIDATTGTLKYIPVAEMMPGTGGVTLVHSPLVPKGVVIQQIFDQSPRPPGTPLKSSVKVWTVDAAGRYGARVEEVSGYVGRHQWMFEGRKLYLQMSQVEEGKRVSKAYTYDPVKELLEPAKEPLGQPWEDKTKPILEAVLVPSQYGAGKVLRSHVSAWLRSTAPSESSEQLLAGRADWAAVNSTNDAVAVIDQGVVTVRMLATQPLEAFRKAKEAAEKADALSRAKQVGTACAIWAADNDDHYPTPEEYNSGTLKPYMRNDKMFDGFVYIFPGGSNRDIKNPSQTPLGYIPVAGGYAVVFSDTSARWMPELPKPPMR